VAAAAKKIDLKIMTQASLMVGALSDSGLYGINHLSYDESTYSLCSGVSRVGVFKHLFYLRANTCVEPSLMKVFPITQGNNLFKFIIKEQSNDGLKPASPYSVPAIADVKKLLIAQQSEYLIKYDMQAGYAGYYQSQSFSSIYDVFEIDARKQRLLLLSGVPFSDSVCAEIVSEESNTLVLKLVLP
jgi:hypothetical protein